MDIPNLFPIFAKDLRNKIMTKNQILKKIKEKVDEKSNNLFKIRRKIIANVQVGYFGTFVERRIKKVQKNGNSVIFIDENSAIRNINTLDSDTLLKILWEILNPSEKKEVALAEFEKSHGLS